MTISSSTRKAGPFNGNGVTTSFPFTFKVFAASDLRVVFTDTAGVETDLVLDSDYSVTLNGDQNANPGGSITYPLSGDELATGEKLTAVGNIEALQETDLTNQGGFYPQVIEDALDRASMLIQQQQEELERTIRAALSDEDTAGLELPTSSARASKVLGFDANGNFVTYTILEGSSVGTTFQQDFTATSGQTEFVTSFDFTPNVNAIYVFQNGSKLLGGTDYTEGVDNTITLTTGAALDDLIEVVSFGISGEGFAEVSALAAAAAASASAASDSEDAAAASQTAAAGSASAASASAAAAAASAASFTIDATPTNGSGNAVSSDGVFDALALKAPTASPTFTGTATASSLNTTGNTSLAGGNWTLDTNGNVQRVIPGGSTLYPDFACRAWVNWNGSAVNGSQTINGSGNVTSVTRTGTGAYTVNFATPMPDANYAYSGTSKNGGGTIINVVGEYNTTPARTATALSIQIETTTSSAADGTTNNVMVKR